MWKQGGRSSALDRAQALLSAKRSTRRDAESVQGPTGNPAAVGGSLKTKSASSNTRPLFSDLSDLSSVSSAHERGGDTMLGSAAADGDADVGKTQDLRPQSSLGGGGSRFLKKAPPPAINSSQSPVRKSQQVPEHRNVSSSQQSSQTAALSKVAQIESRIRSRKQVQEEARRGAKPAENRTSAVGISPPLAAQSLEAPVPLSAQSSSDQSLKGIRFLKNKAAVTVKDITTTAAAAAAAAAGSPKGADVGVRFGSRAALAGLEAKSVRVVSGVSLESDEEDMRKLLGDSLDSVGDSLLVPGRPSSMRTADEMVHSSPPPAAVPPSSSSNTAPTRHPASPSPFRFAGQAQAHFSPSVLSPSASPPRVSPSPQRSVSSLSGRGEVLSLEELFCVGPGFEDPHSEMSAVTSDDFKINVMSLDDLGFSERIPGQEKEVKHSAPPPGSPNRHLEWPRLKKEERRREEDSLDYQSDFESGTEPDYNVSQVSEHLQGDGGEEEAVSEVREEASQSDVCRGRTEDDYSSALSDTSRSWTSEHSQKLDSRSSRSSVSPGSRTLSRQSRRRASTRKVLKEAEVQTQPDPLAYTWPAGVAALGPEVGLTYLDPTLVVAHTLSAERVEALSISNPAVFALNEMLKQQLAMMRWFIESRRNLHSSLVQSLGPPNYRYTTLEDTKENIRKQRPPKLKMEEALEEVLQEMN